MNVEIRCPGDRSVGIPDYCLVIDLGDIEGMGQADYREGIRKACADLGEAITGESCEATFSDQCYDCGQIKEVENICPNIHCISNAPED
jgi:hypothetical protein